MDNTDSQKHILKSTSITGGTQIVSILLGIGKIKIIAIILGPVGVGLVGIYQSIIDIVKTTTSLGISFSAVREIASAAVTGDEEVIAKATIVLRRWSFVTGILGMIITLCFCKQLSKYAFGDYEHTFEIALLSLGLFAISISAGQLALLQGLRKISVLAKVTIFGTFSGLIITLPLYWIYTTTAIVPSFLIASFVSLFFSWIYVRKNKIKALSISLKETFTAGTEMIKLGLSSVVASFIEVGSMFLIRAFIGEKLGMSAVGEFVAAWTISTIYLTTITSAMGADYYPRLCSCQDDKPRMNKMINEQSRIALLLASPIIIGLICFVHIAVNIFYSRGFTGAVTILNWQLLGDFFKILAWPISYAFVARGKGLVIISTSLVWFLLYIIIVRTYWDLWGLEITGIGFTLCYIVYFIILAIMAYYSIGFKFSSLNLKIIAGFLPLIIMAFLSSKYLPYPYQYLVGSIISAGATLVSYHQLKDVIDLKSILRKFRK